MLRLLFLITVLCLGCGTDQARCSGYDTNIVSEYGKLSIKDGQLTNQHGHAIQLKGMSSHGLQWFGQYASYGAMKELRDTWGQTVFRAAMYTAEGGYLSNPSLKNKVHEIIQNARKLDIYVIIDWHILKDRNPLWNKDKAKEFFAEMAQTYADTPNVIYEIANEPNGGDVTWWNSIKPYALEVIPEIRKYSDGIIIVGTSNWSQNIQDSANDPINDENIMYALHFYAGTHGQWLRDRLNWVLTKKIAIFVSEFGAMSSSGNGGLNHWEMDRWMEILDANKISWTAWSLSNSYQSHSVLKQWASPNGGWNDGDLSDHGRMIKKYMLK